MPTRRLGLASMLFLLGALLSGLAWQTVRQNELDKQQVRFDQQAHQIIDALKQCIANSQQVLRGGAALLTASPLNSQAIWRSFVLSQRLQENRLGALGIGFTLVIPEATREQRLLEIRRTEFPSYTIWPETSRSEYAPILYYEPIQPLPKTVVGYDMLSNPVRQAAMEQARDSGMTVLSQTVILITDRPDSSKGLLLYEPVYQKGLPLHTVAQRRQALLGYTFAPFRSQDLFSAIFQDKLTELDVDIYEGAMAQPAQLLYQSRKPSPHAASPQFTQILPVLLAGNQLLLHFHSRPEIEQTSTSKAGLVLGAGLTVSALLFLLTLALGGAEARAQALAQNMTASLRDAEQQTRAILESTADGILTIDEVGRIETANPAIEWMFGYAHDQLLSKPLEQLITAPERSQLHAVLLGRQHELTGLRHDGSTFPMEISASIMRLRDRPCHVCVINDISRRRATEEALQQANALRQSILENAPFMVIATNDAGRLLWLNRTAERLLGYQREELVNQAELSQLHNPIELANHAAALSHALGITIPPGFEALSILPQQGQADTREWSYFCKDGSTLPVEMTISAMHDGQGNISGYLCIATDLSARRQAEEKTHYLTHYDPLTELPNRLLLRHRIQLAIDNARRRHHRVGLLLIDLDNFLRINDSLGHHVGDQLLREVASRLRSNIDKVNTIAHIGADEFVLLLEGRQVHQLRAIARTTLGLFAVPIQIGPHTLHVTASIGCSIFPDDAHDLDSLLRNSDAAMRHVKANGRNNWRLFSPVMDRASSERLELENALWQALENQQFQLRFQPIVESQQGRAIGMEALLTWIHPSRGAISPSTFIPLAEDIGLIIPIGEWVLRTACQETRALQQETGRALRVSVNLSPRQLEDDNLLTMLDQALEDSGLSPDCLELEITEGLLLQHSAQTLDTLTAIRARGIGISIDDFGTGYSSLSYLTRFPIDKLKIDQSFVRNIGIDPNDAAVVAAIIAMAHRLHIQVVAEGVETAVQLAFLRENGCDAVQGYYLSRSIPAREFSATCTDIARRLSGAAALMI